jgi:hypothetical protein
LATPSRGTILVYVLRREAGYLGSWLWLLPATYLIHLGEEVWGGEGYAAWISRLSNSPFPRSTLLLLNLLLLAGMVLILVEALRRGALRWAVVAMGAAILGNSLLHLVASLATRTYSPGLVTGTLLWLPLGIYAAGRGFARCEKRELWLGLAIGLVATVLISIVALNPGLLPVYLR